MSKYYCKLCIAYLKGKIYGNTAYANVKISLHLFKNLDKRYQTYDRMGRIDNLSDCQSMIKRTKCSNKENIYIKSTFKSIDKT